VDSLIVFGFTKSLLGIPLRAFNQWYEVFSASPEAASVHSRFFTTMAPQKRSTGGYLGPYDALIKKYAAQIGWDWRLFAALIYQESHFRIDVTSYRGAKGLLQMMPSTARRFGADDLFNPEESISAGAKYLDNLQRMFAKVAASDIEREKITLAAYNAGEGRILDCINYARFKGVDPSTWDAIVGVIPEMRDESILQVDTVKLGMFQGYETIAYIDSVMDIYRHFCRLCP
ncbi:MAG: transglycosylase SLT domain-containing protein, partial [Bacteroidales bacterium]|nr:transglycosylase SLT domain-containing protein [Bacteroidales bacterium]